MLVVSFSSIAFSGIIDLNGAVVDVVGEDKSYITGSVLALLEFLEQYILNGVSFITLVFNFFSFVSH